MQAENIQIDTFTSELNYKLHNIFIFENKRIELFNISKIIPNIFKSLKTVWCMMKENKKFLQWKFIQILKILSKSKLLFKKNDIMILSYYLSQKR